MRRERLLLAALLGAFVVALSRGAGSPPFVPDIPAPAPVVTPATAPGAPPALRRNPFEFGRAPVEPADATRPSTAPVASAAPSPAVVPVRFVGFVFQGKRTRAVIAVDGETHVLEAGEEAGGYTLLSADEATGVRLRAPGGGELALAVPE